MSILKYAGIILPYAEATQFKQKVTRDPSDTDWYCTDYEIIAQFVVCTDYLAVLAPDLIGGKSRDLISAAGIMKVLQARMMQARKPLSFTFNGVEIIPQQQTGNNGTVDANNGPKPQSFNYIQLTNSTFLVQFHIIAKYWQSTKAIEVEPNGTPIITNDPGNVVLYNRWNEEVILDNCDMSTRTREGQYMIRSDNSQGAIADQVRTSFAVLQVPQGFLRDQATYRVSEDGLNLNYKIIDREVFKGPPTPAFTAKGEYTESSTMGGGLRFGQVNLVLQANKTTSQFALEKKAVQVAIQKFKTASPNNTNLFNAYYEVAIKVNMYENEVAVQMRGMLKAKKSRLVEVTGGGVDTSTSGSDNSTYLPPYTARGTAGFLLRAASYYDPSLQQTKLGNNNQMSTGSQVGTAGKNAETV